MTLLENVLIHGTLFAIVMTVYLLVVMKGLNPRVWAMSDYPEEITGIVPPQTAEEKRLAAYTAIPFLILTFGFPIFSTLILEASFGGTITILDAFLNLFCLILFGTLADLGILDLLIVGTITPDWVIIPGTEHLRETAYKDFRMYHAKGHAKATPILLLLAL
ncbi:MAG: hypothetical protein P1Q69_03580, partial [Candidatus Thorarchaeota archaeon]|nr:hypothetical protein [Candidatus Thorarchaeota archaeon]